ncbi:unnamed protein product, partial [Mesorhabditis belari]|uniref:Uncharacterized protein n=1 Tax=Mesorhabditis belari TaxID=2138241 RepID=A0AAF3EH12_9BILA
MVVELFDEKDRCPKSHSICVEQWMAAKLFVLNMPANIDSNSFREKQSLASNVTTIKGPPGDHILLYSPFDMTHPASLVFLSSLLIVDGFTR